VLDVGETARRPIKFRFNESTRLETRVTESIACGPAFAHNKADCGATGRRDEIMLREHGGDPCQKPFMYRASASSLP
jgi:hypothetical protein